MEPTKKKSKAMTGSRRRVRKSTSGEISASSQAQQNLINIKDKLVLYLNELLSMENASLDRLQTRINETKLQGPKAQFQRHLEETRKQQDRLRQLLVAFGEKKPTEDKAPLSVPFMPKSVNQSHRESIIEAADYELMRTREDMILENAEIINYHFALQLVREARVEEAIRPLSQNMTEEVSMAGWIKSNIPPMIVQSGSEIAGSAVRQT